MAPAMMPAAAVAAKSRPRSRARKNAIGADVNGRPTSQPPTAGPHRRPARLAAPMRAGVRTSLRVRLSRRYLTGATTTSVGEPFKKFSTFCTARRRPSRITSGVWPALCGDRTTLSRPVIGSPGLRGSSWKTSRPAPAIFLLTRASSSASRSTSAPRPVFTRMADRFIDDSSLRPRNPRVSGVSRMWSETKSAVFNISSFAAGRAPSERMCASSPRALHASTSMPMARARVTTRAPMAPVPKTPAVLPRHCVSISRGHAPPRISRSIRGIFRPVASISASVCSATANALTPGVLQTVRPRRPAASRSMLSVPVPQIDTISRLGQAANTPSVKRACARMLMATRARSIRLMSSCSSSAPRAAYTRVSPIFRARSWAGVFSNTLGKSSGTSIVATGGCAARTVGGLFWKGPAALRDTGNGLRDTGDAASGFGEDGLGGGDGGAGLGLVAEVAQRQLQRRERRQHVVRARGDAHGADPECQRADPVEARPDEDAVDVAHAGDHGRRIDVLRRADARDRVGVDRGVREHLETHGRHALAEGGGRDLVPAHAVGEAFLEDQPRRHLQGAGQVGRDGDRLAAGGAVGHLAAARDRDPLLAPAQQIVRVRVRAGLAALHRLPRARADGDERHAERGAQALLRAGHVEVDAPLVGADVEPRDGRDRVE